MNNTLCAVRKSDNLKPEDVAERLNMPIEDYLKLESGETRIDIEMAKKLGDVFNVDPEFFLNTDSKIVNYNSGEKSHSNMVVHPTTYIDVHTGVPQELFEKILRERDVLKKKTGK